ncbi:MAG: hypothetical protein LBU51_11340 [Bacteroidales bacterium]|jgi:hypothetical protein|nr:hypothetical protein [Bacteroidales bacterium]
MKRTVSFEKDDQLYRFILENGFSCSIEQMAVGIKVEKKTLYNRYLNRKNLEITVGNHWKILFIDRLYDKFDQCNNSLEKLLFFILELQKSYVKESIFFQKEIDETAHNNDSPRHPFLLILDTIIAEGQKENLFQEINTTIYTSYLLHNLIYFYFNKIRAREIITFLLAPLLTPKGLEYYLQIDINRFLKISQSIT